MKYLKTFEYSKYYINKKPNTKNEFVYKSIDKKTEIWYNNTDIKEIPIDQITNDIKKMYCSENKNLTSLPELPKKLTELYCFNNNLYKLPKLPYTLKILRCSGNNLSSLPKLPKNLKELQCHNNNLPFDDLNEYKKWYQENKTIIEENGLSYAYQLYHSTKKYNI